MIDQTEAERQAVEKAAAEKQAAGKRTAEADARFNRLLRGETVEEQDAPTDTTKKKRAPRADGGEGQHSPAPRRSGADRFNDALRDGLRAARGLPKEIDLS